MKNEIEFKFGDYAIIEQKRHGVPNEMFVHKVVGQLRSNTWVDVPVRVPATETLHGEMEDICLCICCGIDETEVRRYRVKDMQRHSPVSLVADEKRGSTITLQAVNELIQSLESAGELSIKERKYLDVMRWAIRVAGERDATLNAERVWERAMMEVCGEDGPASVASEIRALQVLRDTAMQALKSQVEQLAAENVSLRAVFSQGEIPDEAVDAFSDTVAIDSDWDESGTWSYVENEAEVIRAVLDAIKPETPATDRIVAGIKADGVESGIKTIMTMLNHKAPGVSDAINVLRIHSSELREGGK